jgi:hypothetical protein
VSLGFSSHLLLRKRNVTVLDALARALCLDDDAIAYMYKLASNAAAQALAPALRPGANSLRALFLAPELQACYHDLPLVQNRAVAYLRAKVGDELDDPELNELLEELDQGSPEFRELWARHDVLGISATGDTGFKHPQLGTINLRYWTLSLPSVEGLTLLVYSAASGSRDAQALAKLASMDTSSILGTTPDDDGSERQL